MNQQTNPGPLTFIIIPNSLSTSTYKQQTELTSYLPIKPRSPTQAYKNDTNNMLPRTSLGPGTKPEALTCSICGLKCKNKSQLKYHLLIHAGVKSHVCKTCGKTFTRKWDLHRHYDVHKKKGKYKPKDKAVDTVKSLNSENALEKTSSVENKVSAPIINEKSEYFVEEVKDSVAVDAETTKNLTKTDNAERAKQLNTPNARTECLFKHPSDFDKSQMTNNSSNVDNSDHSATDKRQNVQTHYRPIRPRPTTEICTNSYTNVNNMSLSRIFSPLTCSTCGLKCKDKSHLKVHVLIHTGVKPHVCKTCSKAFTREWDLHRHQSVHRKTARRKSKRKAKDKSKSMQEGDTLRVDSPVEKLKPASIVIIQDKLDGNVDHIKDNILSQNVNVDQLQDENSVQFEDDCLNERGNNVDNIVQIQIIGEHEELVGFREDKNCNNGFVSTEDKSSHDNQNGNPVSVESNSPVGQTGKSRLRAFQTQRCSPHKTNTPIVQQGKISQQTTPQVLNRSGASCKAMENFTCTVCGLKCRNKGHWNLHSLIHTGERPHVCILCGKSFTRKFDMNRHEYLHRQPGKGKLKCTLCTNVFFSDKSQLDSHIQLLHSHIQLLNKSDKESRPNVNEQLSNGSELSDLSDIKENADQSVEHGNVSSIAHMHTVTNDERSQQTTPYTPQTINSSGAPCKTKGNLTCNICGLKCRNKGHWNLHSLIHTGEKPHVCSFCSKSFTRKFDMNRHKVLHRQPGKGKVKCVLCTDIFFSDTSQLDSHILLLHKSDKDSILNVNEELSGGSELSDFNDIKEDQHIQHEGHTRYRTTKLADENEINVDENTNNGNMTVRFDSTREVTNSFDGIVAEATENVNDKVQHQHKCETLYAASKVLYNEDRNQNVDTKLENDKILDIANEQTKPKVTPKLTYNPDISKDNEHSTVSVEMESLVDDIPGLTDCKIEPIKPCPNSQTDTAVVQATFVTNQTPSKVTSSNEHTPLKNEDHLRCSDCGQKCSNQHNLILHSMIHTGEKCFNCEICNKGFKRRYHMKTHMLIHRQKTIYKCKLCSASYNSKSMFDRHVHVFKHKQNGYFNSNTKERNVQHSRSDSSAPAEERSEHINDMNKTENVESDVVIQEIKDTKPCVKETLRKEQRMSINENDKFVQSDGLKDWTEECMDQNEVTKPASNSISSMNKFSDHMLHFCDTCNKGFCWITDLERHIIMVHVVNKSLSCDNKGQQCNRWRSLPQEQKEEKHTPTYECRKCLKTFQGQLRIQKHKSYPCSTRPYACSECPKRYIWKHNLKEHQRLHRADNPYTCSDCGMRFTRSSHFLDHCKTHTGKPKRECILCKRTFATSGSLDLHIKQHHAKIVFCKKCGEQFENLERLELHKLCHFKQGYGVQAKNIDKLKKHTLYFDEDKTRGRYRWTQRKPKKVYQCHICNKLFNRIGHLSTHLLKHTQLGLTHARSVKSTLKACVR